MGVAARPLLGLAALMAGAALAATPAAVTERPDGRSPLPWRTLDAGQAARFDLGHALFNTAWVPAGAPAGRRDGLGPLFNAPSCDACHNSRRRGRGPEGDGPAPIDLVLKAGTRRAGGAVLPGHALFGEVINTAAIGGFGPEAEVGIRYQRLERARADGTVLVLWKPVYTVVPRGGARLPRDLVLMPRMPPSVQGMGLLEQVPEAAVADAADAAGGTPSWLETPRGRRLGRFGWQATEPTLDRQVAVAFAREMGLSNPVVAAIDCARRDSACRRAATGGDPEVQPDLFQALLDFQRWESVRRAPSAAARTRDSAAGAPLFEASGCSACHRPRLPLGGGGWIEPYTDLRLHDLGPSLADADALGNTVPTRWRTAPLWGLSAAMEGGRRVRLLHDGRARSIEEAIGWHGGEAAAARERFESLDPAERQRLLDWVSSL